MSTPSTIRAFKLCHVNDYTSTTSLVELPVKPILPMKGTNNMVSSFAFEDVRGTFTELLIADKKQMDLEFIVEGESNLALINSYIEDKIITYGSRFFMFNFYMPTNGWVLSKVYIGTPIEAETLVIGTSSDGSDTKTRLKFSIIEVEGTKF